MPVAILEEPFSHHAAIDAILDSSRVPRHYLEAATSTYSYVRDETIAPTSVNKGALLIVESGNLRLGRPAPTGFEATLCYCNPGSVHRWDECADYCGDYLSVLSSTAILAHIDIARLPIGRDCLAPWLYEQSRLQVMLANRCIAWMSFQTVRERLASVLLYLGCINGGHIMAANDELASMVSSCTDHVRRLLKALRESGCVTSLPHRRGIDISDWEALRRVAGEAYSEGPFSSSRDWAE